MSTEGDIMEMAWENSVHHESYLEKSTEMIQQCRVKDGSGNIKTFGDMRHLAPSKNEGAQSF